MKSAPAGLAALLATGQFVSCDDYTFTLTSGQVLRHTTCDTDVNDVGGRRADFVERAVLRYVELRKPVRTKARDDVGDRHTAETVPFLRDG